MGGAAAHASMSGVLEGTIGTGSGRSSGGGLPRARPPGRPRPETQAAAGPECPAPRAPQSLQLCQDEHRNLHCINRDIIGPNSDVPTLPSGPLDSDLVVEIT